MDITADVLVKFIVWLNHRTTEVDWIEIASGGPPSGVSFCSAVQESAALYWQSRGIAAVCCGSLLNWIELWIVIPPTPQIMRPPSSNTGIIKHRVFEKDLS
jgi:hypothetical protein